MTSSDHAHLSTIWHDRCHNGRLRRAAKRRRTTKETYPGRLFAVAIGRCRLAGRRKTAELRNSGAAGGTATRTVPTAQRLPLRRRRVISAARMMLMMLLLLLLQPPHQGARLSGRKDSWCCWLAPAGCCLLRRRMSIDRIVCRATRSP